MRHRPSVEALFQKCPALLNYLQGNYSLDTSNLEMALDELEGHLSLMDQQKFEADRAARTITQDLAKAGRTIGRLLGYIRLMQMIISQIAEGRINPPLRAAVQHIADAWVQHRAALDLGQDPLGGVQKHIDRMQGTTAILFGIDEDELKRHVYDLRIDESEPRPINPSPFDGVEGFKYRP